MVVLVEAAHDSTLGDRSRPKRVAMRPIMYGFLDVCLLLDNMTARTARPRAVNYKFVGVPVTIDEVDAEGIK